MKKAKIILLLLCGNVFGADMTIPVFNGEDQIELTYIGESQTGHDVEFVQDGDTWRAIITLYEPPDCNSWSYRLEDGGAFDYYYQEPFTCYETFYENGIEWRRMNTPFGVIQRPAYIDGSIAVYHKTKRNHILGRTNYKCGKVAHIIADSWDAYSQHCKTTIGVKDGIYTVSVPWSWLEQATYPVRINDTFGYTSVGGSELINNAGDLYGTGPFTVPSAATGTAIYAAVRSSSGEVFTAGVYTGTSDPSGTVVSDGASTVCPSDNPIVAFTSGGSFDNPSSPTFSTSTNYWMAIQSGATIAIAYDSSTSNESETDSDASYGDGSMPPFNRTGDFGSAVSFSIYASYAVGGSSANTAYYRRRQ